MSGALYYFPFYFGKQIYPARKTIVDTTRKDGQVILPCFYKFKYVSYLRKESNTRKKNLRGLII